MKKKKLYYMVNRMFYIGLFLLLMMSSCIDKKAGTGQVVSNPIEVDFVKDGLSGSQILQGGRIVSLSSKEDEALIAEMDKLLVGEDRYFVMDRGGNKVIAFNGEGEYVASTARYVGQGPDNYIRVIDAVIDNASKKLYVHCDAPYCMMVFDMNLQLLEKISMDYYMREVADDDKYIYGIRVKDASDFGYELVALDKSDLSASPRVLLEYSEVIFGARAIGKSLSPYGKGVNVCLPFDDTIYQISDGKIIAQYSLDFGSKGVDYSDIKGMSVRELYRSTYGQRIWSLVNIYSSDSTLFFGCNREYSFVLNRNTGVCSGYSRYDNDLMPYSTNQTFPVDGLDNAFAYAWPSSYVMTFKRRVADENLDADWKKHLEKYMNAEMEKILDGYEEEDNPLIILCVMK